MKNIDWIKSLNVNEMAEILESVNPCGCCAYFFEKGDCNGKCEEGAVKWLEQEHEEKLKPCPFCGSDDIKVKSLRFGNLQYFAMCENCRTSLGAADTEQEAREKWNERFEEC